MSWMPLGAVAPSAMERAKRHAHWAAQVIAAVGETHLTHEADTSHTAMSWDPTHRALVGHPIETGSQQLRVGLALPALGLLVLGGRGEPIAERPLAGSTLDEAREWAAGVLVEAGGSAFSDDLIVPGYEMPAHALSESGRFEADAPALEELARWFANAHEALEGLVAREGATPVLCWPHHFDIASLIVEARTPAGEASRTIGVGCSPGDEAIAEPYWYVNHWPGREDPELGQLVAGRWQTDGFVAAVLEGSELVQSETQEDTLRAWLDSALGATRQLFE